MEIDLQISHAIAPMPFQRRYLAQNTNVRVIRMKSNTNVRVVGSSSVGCAQHAQIKAFR